MNRLSKSRRSTRPPQHPVVSSSRKSGPLPHENHFAAPKSRNHSSKSSRRKHARQAPAPPVASPSTHAVSHQQPVYASRTDLAPAPTTLGGATDLGGQNRGASRTSHTSTVVPNVNNNKISTVPIRRVASPERSPPVAVSHLRTTDSLARRSPGGGSSYAGNMMFDDEFDSVMSSSHVDYEHSSADEADDLVKRSLVKASNRRAPIEDIQEENMTATAYVQVAPPASR